jgi:hypothetical protein
MTVAQDAVPGASVFHAGWYNALNIALFVLAAVQKKREVIALFGCAIVVFAGASAGLMAPDTHAVVGAPGASVRDDQIGGSFVFPLSGSVIRLQRGRSDSAIDGGRKYSGGFIMWQQPRDVVYVQAADARGNNLTITQPTNASFLSPVLLMQQSTVIAGMSVRFDTFAVPAVGRSVKAVLFTPQQAAQLRTDPLIVGGPAVLFDVSNNADHEIPGGIGIIASGTKKRIGDLLLGASVGTYPAVVVASGPYLPVLVLGLIVIVFGVARQFASKQAR